MNKSKVVDITKYFGTKRRKPKGRPVELPEWFCISVRRIPSEEGEIYDYDASHQLLYSAAGRTLLVEFFLAVTAEMYDQDPYFIIELGERLQEWAHEMLE